MTIHCAITYFDQSTHSAGFLIGSDSAAIIQPLFDKDAEGLELDVDKSIRGKNTIGFVRGSIELCPKNLTQTLIRSEFDSILRTLDTCFDDVYDGASYGFLSSMMLSRHVILVGKYSQENLELYTISNMRSNNNNIATLLYKITPSSYITEKKSMTRYAPSIKDYLVFSLNGRLTRPEAQKHIEKMLALDLENIRDVSSSGIIRKPRKPNVYALDFAGIRCCSIDILKY